MSSRARYYCNVMMASMDELALKRMARDCARFKTVRKPRYDIRTCMNCRHCLR